MFDHLDSALWHLDQILEGLDPEALDPGFARELFEKFTRVERLGAAGKALSARRVANSGEWMNTSERSPAHWMAEVAGTSVGRAVAVLQTAERLQGLPATEAAYRRGDLSEPQVEEIACTAALSPDSQQDLLAAEGEALVELRRQCARVRAAARSEKDTHDYLHRHRRLNHWTDLEGAFRLSGRFTPECGAVIMAALEPFRNEPPFGLPAGSPPPPTLPMPWWPWPSAHRARRRPSPRAGGGGARQGGLRGPDAG